MKYQAIHRYHQTVERIVQFGGSKKETSIRVAFQNLLNEYAKERELILIPELTMKNKQGKNIMPDGTLKDILRLDWGYWESKDEDDDIDQEIRKKFEKGYPNDNILFEDSKTAVLIQDGTEVQRVSFKNEKELDSLIRNFISFERPEVQEFRKAIELFKEDIPIVANTLRDVLVKEGKTNKKFIESRKDFLNLCQKSINPDVSLDDVREMIIQHILTEDIFNTIFDEIQFHRENNIAQELHKLINTFFSGNLKRQTFSSISHYYKAINATAAGIFDHHEKQKFLKIVYENFYKSYNPDAADKLGVVYTPNEIVKFMIHSTDYFMNKHFSKYLEDENVHILDPATGTGTFICDLIDYIRKEKLEHKYKNELHSNELAILPYYISNLNIEYTYNQKMGSYLEFENHCLVDTLDNMAFNYRGKQGDLFDPFTEENSVRIKRQNDQRIAVIIGNPPYNANQQNFNDFNKNREYAEIDKRIKDSFVSKSNAQKTKSYDMYSRFYRWSMDRINEKGIITFITNNSFINKKTYDGFRKSIQDEFQFAYIVDLGGDIRHLSGKDGIFLNEDHTIFGQAAAVGIAIMFLVKDTRIKNKECQIKYIHPTDIRATRVEKLNYLRFNKIEDFPFENIRPDNQSNWINLANNDFDDLLSTRKKSERYNIFDFTSLGVSTNRDEWVYDFNIDNLKDKTSFFVETYNQLLETENGINNNEIKWSDSVKNSYKRAEKFKHYDDKVIESTYRPFINKFYYADIQLSDRLTRNHFKMFGPALDLPNQVFCVASYERKPFSFLVTDKLPNLNYFGDPAHVIPKYTYDENGTRTENISNWALNKFTKKYGTKKITKDDIFNYIYAVLHNPNYRSKYELNLNRELPRIPLYDDFIKWKKWGESLLDLHINFTKQANYPLTVETKESDKETIFKLKANKELGEISIDSKTKLIGIPDITWMYKLGNRSALEWIIDQYKEVKYTEKSMDKTPYKRVINENFNKYRISDLKSEIIDTIEKICTISIETVKIVDEMKAE